MFWMSSVDCSLVSGSLDFSMAFSVSEGVDWVMLILHKSVSWTTRFTGSFGNTFSESLANAAADTLASSVCSLSVK